MFRLRPAVVVVAPDSGAQDDLRMRVAIVRVALLLWSLQREEVQVRVEGETPTVVSVEYRLIVATHFILV